MSADATERDILGANVVTMNVATSELLSPDVASKPDPQPMHVGYFMSAQGIYAVPETPSVSVLNQPTETRVSPTWLGRVKKRIKEMAQLTANWDSYVALPVDPRIPPIADALVEWFAVDNLPPPDVFATSDGGMQLEWHIHRVNIEIELTSKKTIIRFHDLTTLESWSRASSSPDLQIMRRRLLVPV